MIEITSSSSCTGTSSNDACSPGEELLVLVVVASGIGDDDGLDPGRRQVRELAVDEQDARARMLDDVLDLVRARQAGVDRDEYAARSGNAEVGLEERRDVRSQESHPIALLEPALEEGRGESPRSLLELAVRQVAIPVDDGCPIREDRRASMEKGDRIQLVPVDPVTHVRGLYAPGGR